VAETVRRTIRTEATAGPNGTSRHSVRDLSPFLVDAGRSGPSPLELLLVALNGCTAVLVAMVAQERRLAVRGASFLAEGDVDYRGLMGVAGVLPYFQAVRQTVRVTTDLSDAELRLLGAEVERRCPVANLLRSAGVPLQTTWVREG